MRRVDRHKGNRHLNVQLIFKQTKMFNFFTNPTKPKPTISSSRTSSRVVTLQHEWTIDNLARINMEQGAYITSDKFSLPDHPHIEFYLELFPGGFGRRPSDYMSLFLQSNIEKDFFILWFKLSFKKSSTEIRSQKHTATFGKFKKVPNTDIITQSKCWGWFNFLPKRLLGSLKLRESSLDGPIVVQCKIRYVTDVKTIDI